MSRSLKKVWVIISFRDFFVLKRVKRGCGKARLTKEFDRSSKRDSTIFERTPPPNSLRAHREKERERETKILSMRNYIRIFFPLMWTAISYWNDIGVVSGLTGNWKISNYMIIILNSDLLFLQFLSTKNVLFFFLDYVFINHFLIYFFLVAVVCKTDSDWVDLIFQHTVIFFFF